MGEAITERIDTPMDATHVTVSPEVQKRRDILTAQAQLRIAEAVAGLRKEQFPGDRAAAQAHAVQLRAYIADRSAEG